MADGMNIKGQREAGCGQWAQLLLVFVCCLLFAVSSCAEELADPTRPPASIAEPVVKAGGIQPKLLAGLQSIILGKHRRAAIIDGQTVELGGRHNDAKLVEVNEGSVVLQTAQGRQVLTLFPDVKMTQKTAVSDSTPARVRAGTHKPDTHKTGSRGENK